MVSKIVKVYDYLDATGQLKFQVVRFEPKTFLQRRLYNGDFVWGLKKGWYERNRRGSTDYYHAKNCDHNPDNPPHCNAIWFDEQEPYLYRLPAVLQGIKDQQTIYLTEGEKDADNLSLLGFITTSPPMGAKWKDSYTEYLKPAYFVVILADKDEIGRPHAQSVANNLFTSGVKSKILELPDINGKKIKDISDWLEANGTKKEFEELVNNCPIWQPLEDQELNSTEPSSNELFKSITKKYGNPYYLDAKGNFSGLNESFWAALHFEEHIELYEPTERIFYRYDPNSGLYTSVSEDVIKQEISLRMLDVSREDSQPGLEMKRNNPTLINIVSHLRGIAEHRNCFNNKKEHYVHLSNGVVLIKENGEADLVEFSPRFLSRNRSPLHFDPTAKCDRFLNEVLYTALNNDDALLIQKYAGLCLLGINLPQRILILDGMAGRGKSLLVLIIQYIVGLINSTQLRTNLLHERFEIYRYLKKTLLTGIDVPGTFLSERGALVIKGLVGGDNLDAERKGNPENFPIKGNFCVLITSNSRLHIRFDGDLGAWKRRLLIIRFEAPPPKKKIPEFADLLIKEEGPGILNWALGGLALLLDDIKSMGDIRMTDKQAGIVDALLAESDSIRHFLKECVEQDGASDLAISEIIERYAEFCPVKGWHAKPITVIYKELEGLMLELFGTSKSNSISRHQKQVRGFRRVRFQDKPNYES